MTQNRSFSQGIRWLMPLLAVLLAGCAIIPHPTVSDHLGTDDPAGRCADLFADLDRRVAAADVIDAGAFRVPGYPYLRVDRFLASFADEVAEPAAFEAWVDRMQAMDRTARRHEIANLPDAGSPADRVALQERVQSCADRLRAADLQDDAARRALAEAVTAPEDYLLLRQIVGLYPLPRWVIGRGVTRWQAEVRRDFTTAPPQQWSANVYAPPAKPDPAAAARLVVQAQRDALGIPHYSQATEQQLFEAHAPVWQVQAGSAADRIGTPIWRTEKRLAVDTGRPVTYTLLSHTRFQGAVLTQLNYMIWFPARPKSHPLDIYGGLLDGVILRVTLDRDGRPLLYDTVHHCGCYYAAFPTERIEVRDTIAYREPPLILPGPGAAVDQRQRLAVGMQRRTHFVRHLYLSDTAQSMDAVVYTLAPYDRLRALPHGTDQRRSMFAPDSLAPGSQRLERWLFWPTGVYSAGAMRQWGRHAVAFAGRRHFDDPFYMEEMFTAD
ncbi:MAG: hypothetical protein KFF50_04245 [Desulfatitalea sp.]|nr:hypothetical protein [Desulfatitalea sp.]